jgi:phenylalanyl-tRNA synthetase beta chain
MDCLGNMGYDTSKNEKGKIDVYIPAWRSDILHDIDLVEDVAVGHGFDRFETDLPKAMTFGKVLSKQHLYDHLRGIMIGLGFNEVTTFTISNDNDEFIKMGLEVGSRTQIENPIGEEYSILRVSLLPSLLKILSENRHHPLPQQIFEVGIVVGKDFKNSHNLAGVKIDAKANFTECKSLVETVMRDANVEYTITHRVHPAFVKGRCASIVCNGSEIGFFGELHPKTITAFDLEHHVIAFEIKADNLTYQ